ncbi:MAG: hypothetical protein H6719_23855 [Sandaracinaceae bacterium]|nr:hypothetical protein [Sandaracinaceae bacterium]
MLDEIVRSAAQLLDAPVQHEAGSWFIDVWVFLDPHDPDAEPRRQIVQLFEGEAHDLLYLSSTVGPYSDDLALAPLLRQMVGAMHCSLYLAAPDPEGVEHLKVSAAVETSTLHPERLADLAREVAVFADRFEADLFGREVDVR